MGVSEEERDTRSLGHHVQDVAIGDSAGLFYVCVLGLNKRACNMGKRRVPWKHTHFFLA